jgi:hypothetical protein
MVNRTLFLLAIALAAPTLAQVGKPGAETNGLDSSKFDSIWSITLKPTAAAHAPSLAQPKRMIVINVEGSPLQLFDPDTQKSVPGKMVKGAYLFAVPTFDADDVLLKFNPKAAGSSSAEGTAVFGDQMVVWSAATLASAWECSNHAPKYHLATSEAEMQKLTKEQKCEGFHRVKPKDDNYSVANLNTLLSGREYH